MGFVGTTRVGSLRARFITLFMQVNGWGRQKINFNLITVGGIGRERRGGIGDTCVQQTMRLGWAYETIEMVGFVTSESRLHLVWRRKASLKGLLRGVVVDGIDRGRSGYTRWYSVTG